MHSNSKLGALQSLLFWYPRICLTPQISDWLGPILVSLVLVPLPLTPTPPATSAPPVTAAPSVVVEMNRKVVLGRKSERRRAGQLKTSFGNKCLIGLSSIKKSMATALFLSGTKKILSLAHGYATNASARMHFLSIVENGLTLSVLIGRLKASNTESYGTPCLQDSLSTEPVTEIVWCLNASLKTHSLELGFTIRGFVKTAYLKNVEPC
mmetsp:Transcript_10485/g.16060  ORF Transcript_10485/g.16060 Transcript_10485/m.16060 type:complete len:209 (-) Transcript_10485:137-763(-)